MARIRTEDQIFFIFNHQALTCEEDDLKNAIVYFFPTSISIDGQCALVGQLMGLVDFFKSFSASPPLVYILEKNKVAIKHLGQYTMALSGNRMEPDCVVITQLNYIYNIFVFYFGNLQELDEEHKGNIAGMSPVMHDIWDCYLPFVRRYGDNVAAAFDSLPILDMSESLRFLKASQLLQDCQTMKDVIAGCILYKNRVLYSQLCPDITARLLVIQSQESHLPCKPVKTDAALSEGVKLINVFLKEDDYKLMKHILKEKCLSAKVTKENASYGHHSGSVDCNKETKQLKQGAEGNTGINKRITLGNPEPDICRKTTSQVTNGHIESSQSDITKSRNVAKKQPSPVSSVPSYGRQRSCEFRSSNVIGIEHTDTDSDDYRKDWVVVGNWLSPDDKNFVSDTAAVWDLRKGKELWNNPPDNESYCYDSEFFSDNITLFKHVNKATAQCKDKLEAVYQQTDLNNDNISNNSAQDVPGACRDSLTNLGNTSVESNHLKQCNERSVNSNIKVHYSEDKQIGYRKKAVMDDTAEGAFSNMLNDMLETKKSNSLSPKQKDVVKDLEASFSEESSLVTLNLYIQGVADTLLLLFMESTAITDNMMINDMVEIIAPHLVDLNSHLSELSAHNDIKEEMPLCYNYLTYSSNTKNLSGQISMSHGILQPLSHEELDFCGTAIAMHDEFEKSPGLVDLTMRNQTSCIYGHKSFSQEVYFQPKHCRPPRGISPARDAVMCLGDVACQSLLIDRGISIT